MQIYIFILLFISIFAGDKYKSGIGNIIIEKILYAKDTDKNLYLEKLSKLEIPEEAKIWLKDIRGYETNKLKSNIDLDYDYKIGGKGKGEVFYFNKNRGRYLFIYGTATLRLLKLKPYLEAFCKRPMPNLPHKCVYHRTQPDYQEYYFKEYIGKRIRNELLRKIK